MRSSTVGPVKALKRATAVVAVLAVGWAVATIPLFFFPIQERPSHADAIVVLSGAAYERLPVGQQLYDEGSADVLVVSDTGAAGNADAGILCGTEMDPGIICFSPKERSTRGEARSIGKLAKAHGWTSIIVVTSTYHLRRATTLMDQATGIDVFGVASEPTISSTEWMWHLVHESVGLVDALVRPEDPI